MPRKLIGHMDDAIELNADLIREYIETNQVDLGEHPKSRIGSFRTKLVYLKQYAYHRMVTDTAPALASCVHTVMKYVETDWEPSGLSPFTNEKMVRIYWRPDRIRTAREKAGLPGRKMTEEQKKWLEESREYLLKNLPE